MRPPPHWTAAAKTRVALVKAPGPNCEHACRGGECGKAPGDDSREGRGRRDISGLLEGGQGGQAACFWCLIARVAVNRCAPSDRLIAISNFIDTSVLNQ